MSILSINVGVCASSGSNPLLTALLEGRLLVIISEGVSRKTVREAAFKHGREASRAV